jgi:ribonuclease HII
VADLTADASRRDDASQSADAPRPADAVTLDVTAEHGADDAYPVVAAASVVAKVERDRRIAAIADDYPSYEVGSGYPADETTREFLRAFVRDTGDLPDCARASWATAADLLAAAEQSGLEEF